jgi:hypothetical protein
MEGREIAPVYQLCKKSCHQTALRGATLDKSHENQTRPGWQPLTLKGVLLVPVVIFTAVIAIGLGLLQWWNFKHKGVFVADVSGKLPAFTNFLFQYFPIMIVVLYGLLWSWIDLDIKRLEPWFQLANSRGSRAEASLLLHYPVEFLPFVPFRAWKRRYVICHIIVQCKADEFSDNGLSFGLQ